MAADLSQLSPDELRYLIARKKQDLAAQGGSNGQAVQEPVQSAPQAPSNAGQADDLSGLSKDELQYLVNRKQQELAAQAPKGQQQPQAPSPGGAGMFPFLGFAPQQQRQQYNAAMNQVLNDPARAAKVTGASALQTAQGLANFLGLQNLVPQNAPYAQSNAGQPLDTNWAQKLGVSQQQPGDELLSILPLLATPEAASIEAPGISGMLGRAGVRGAEGAAYGSAGGQDPYSSAVAGLVGGAVPEVTRGIGNIPKSIGTSARNKVLDYLNKRSQVGGAFTPEQANVNLLRNYLSPEGKPLPVDIGALTNNPALSNIFGVNEKFPFSSDKRLMVQKGIGDRETQKALTAKSKALDDANSDLNAALQEKAAQQIDRTETTNRLSSTGDKLSTLNNLMESNAKDIQAAPDFLNSLSLKGDETQGAQMKRHLQSAFKQDKDVSKKLYDAVDAKNIPLSEISDSKDFKKYNSALNKFAGESGNLKLLFGNDRDLGTELSNEIESGKNFMRGNRGYSVDAVLSHVRNLQQIGAAAKNAGHNAVASSLNGIASAMKEDMKDILRKNGYAGNANALEAADKHHQENIVPYYQNSEIRKVVTDKDYKPSSTTDLAKKLLHENQWPVFDKLAPEAQRATVFHAMTKEKPSATGVANLSPEKTADAYQDLLTNQKRKIYETHPDINNYFEGLNSKISTQKQHEQTAQVLEKEYDLMNKKLSMADKSDAKIEKAHEKRQKAEQRYADFLDSFYPKPEKGKKSIPLIKGGAATYAAYAAPHITLSALLGGALGAKRVNRVLSDPELIEKYITKSKFEKLGEQPVKQKLGTKLLLRGQRQNQEANNG